MTGSLGISVSDCLPGLVSYMFGKTFQPLRSGALDATLPISNALSRPLPRNGVDVGKRTLTMLAAPPVFNRHAPGFELYLHLRFNPLNLQARSDLEVRQIQSTAPKK